MQSPAKVKQFVIDGTLKSHWEDYLAAKQIVEQYGPRFKELFDEADEVVMDGRVVATNKVDTKFSVAKFKSDHPHLADQYTRQELKEVFDEEKFKRLNTTLWQAYRGRSLRLKAVK